MRQFSKDGLNTVSADSATDLTRVITAAQKKFRVAGARLMLTPTRVNITIYVWGQHNGYCLAKRIGPAGEKRILELLAEMPAEEYTVQA